MARWTAPALRDFSEGMAFIARDDPEAARRVAERVGAAVRRLEQFPLLGKMGRRHGTRELVLPRLPYVLVYRAEGDSSVTILRLLHTSRIWPVGS